MPQRFAAEEPGQKIAQGCVQHSSALVGVARRFQVNIRTLYAWLAAYKKAEPREFTRTLLRERPRNSRKAI
jgi:hypothetical protein